jgi:hypothetical protein
VELDAAAGIGRDRGRQVPPAARALRDVDIDVLAGVIVHRAVELQPDHRNVAGDPHVLDDRAVPPGGPLLGVGGAAHHPDDQVERLVGRLVDGAGPGIAEVRPQRRQQGAPQRVVMLWQHTVFAVVPAELSQKGDRFLGALGDEFAVHPVQGVGESGPLPAHFGREQVTYRHVEAEPVRIEPADEFVIGARLLLRESVAQHPQRFLVLEPHGARF